jgi:hypothetical protein
VAEKPKKKCAFLWEKKFAFLLKKKFAFLLEKFCYIFLPFKRAGGFFNALSTGYHLVPQVRLK